GSNASLIATLNDAPAGMKYEAVTRSGPVDRAGDLSSTLTSLSALSLVLCCTHRWPGDPAAAGWFAGAAGGCTWGAGAAGGAAEGAAGAGVGTGAVAGGAAAGGGTVGAAAGWV